MKRIALGLLLAAMVVVASACDRTLAQGRIQIMAGDLPDASMVEGGGWQSSGWFSAVAPERDLWIEFPAMTLLEIHHPLGRTPASVEMYLTIDTRPDDQSQPEDFGASAVPAAGAAARIIDVNTNWVEVRNDIADAQRLRIVLR
jgi:hypothetical protein